MADTRLNFGEYPVPQSKSSVKRKAIEERKKRETLILRVVGIVVLVVVIAWLATTYFQKSKSAAESPIPTAALPPSSSSSASGAKQWSSAPPMTIDPTKQYFATVKMAKGGEFVIQLYADKAPVTVNNFVFLARQGFFDGTTFHRVLDGFMAQGGDPTGTGMGGPGYQFQDEFSDLKFDKAGLLAMANSGPGTNGSQFFITFDATPWLDGKHTIFGFVVSGMDVVNGLTRRDPSANPGFPGDAIASVTIEER